MKILLNYKLLKRQKHLKILAFHETRRWNQNFTPKFPSLLFIYRWYGEMWINSLESFLGTKVLDLKIKAANNIEVDIDGIVTFNFCISSLNDSFKVPFIVTKQNFSTLIIGFNIIKHLVKTYPNSDFIKAILNSAFPHLNCVKTGFSEFNSRKKQPVRFSWYSKKILKILLFLQTEWLWCVKLKQAISEPKIYLLYFYQN